MRFASLTAAAGLAVVALAGCNGRDTSQRQDSVSLNDSATRRDSASALSAAPPTTVATDSGPPAPAPLVPKPAHVRGLYVNRWMALGDMMWQLIDVAKRTEVNALVIDVKDDRGFVLYPSRVPLAREIGADTNRPMRATRMRAVLDTMRAYGIYPIARIVVAKDPLLAEAKLDWAIKRRDDPTKPWLDKDRRPWLDPHRYDVWKYSADLAREAVVLGFSEIQLDYVRFPDEDRLIREADFPLAQGRTRAQVIREQLGAMRAELASLKVPFTIDVFGLTTSDTTDMGIGQRWEAFVDKADVILPMTYPSHYAPGNYGLGNPNARPYMVIDRALRDAKRRTATVPGAGEIRPWYQDFTHGAPRYGATEVRAQIQAGYDNGVRSWLLWNPRSRYTLSALRAEGDTLTETERKVAEPPKGDSAADTSRPRLRSTLPPGAPPPGA